MRPASIAAVLVIGSVCCSQRTTDPGAPFLRGIITSRESFHAGAGGRADSASAILVDGTSLHPGLEPCQAQARFHVGRSTQIVRDGAPGDMGALLVGRRVAVWITGPVRESCPPQADAARIEIERQ